MRTHAGSEWIRAQLPHVNKDRKGIAKNPNSEMSDLGVAVADLLGVLFYGIYHLDHKALYRVDWQNKTHIEFSLGWHQLATVDFDELTRLVFLAHHMAIRVSIESSTRKYLQLTFHQRTRAGTSSHRHLTLDGAVTQFKVSMIDSIPEYRDEPTESL